ncbi:MAG TPA: hypothetical protein PLU72_18270 [Candidatus Ozemobacteraceae bacterium]|nr:hypothetical protein [Candidatus Ozemobacteraceae bacterium]HQG27092.1 hypothetical protein [Candidatus Ozemobacteraceae bacterium]
MNRDQDLLNQNKLPYRVYPGNRIIVTIGEKAILLKWTADQYRRYLDLIAAQKDRKLPDSAVGVLRQVPLDRLDILEIACNPKCDQIDVTREELATLDMNHQGHIAEMWSQEMLNPGLAPNDPARAPGVV